MTFIYKPKGRLYHKFIGYALSSTYVDKIICFSKEECKYYSDLFNIERKNLNFFH